MNQKSPLSYGKQWIDEEDIQSVVEVLKSDYLTQGPKILEFEKAVSTFCEIPYATSVANATLALHLACRALGVEKESRVWTVPNTFVASANAARSLGAEVDFVDIHPSTYNLDIQKLEEKLIQAQKRNSLPQLLIPVHFAGQSCEMKEIFSLAKKYGFSILEDASHSLGGTYEGAPVGNCRYSDLAVFSFHPVKMITTGEGGMVMSPSEKPHQLMQRLRTHGITRDPEQMQKKDEGPWYYEQWELGWNYRMIDLEAALGISQLKKLDFFVRRRNEIARLYQQQLKDLPLQFQSILPNATSSYHLFVVRIPFKSLGLTRKELFKSMKDQGILLNVHYIPVHLQPYYQNLGFKPGDFPEAEKYSEETISLPIFPSLTDPEVQWVCDSLRDCLSKTG